MQGEVRSIFLVLAARGYEPTAAVYELPLNQPLREVLELALAFLRMKGVDALGSADDYALRDLYGERLDPGLLIRHVPFPGCVLAVSRTGATKVGDQVVEGDEAAAVVARSLAMKLLAQREDEEDKLLTRYGRFIRSGFWRFEPTPITDIDVGVTCHAEHGGLARGLVLSLEAKGLRCRARVANADGSSSGIEPGRSPAESARALVVMIGQATGNDPWLAYDTGAAWAAGIPVVPVLVGKWTGEPPDILAPYQRLSWDAQQERLVNDLVELLDLTPWSAVATAQKAARRPRGTARARAPKKAVRRRPTKASGKRRQ
jgi:hypothetical protein